MAGTYSKAIASAVCNYFSSKNYKYEFIEEKGILTAGFTISGKLGSYKQYIFFHENNYQVYSVVKMNVDEAQRADVCEYLCRCNYGLKYGNFEMDMSDGQVRVKINVDCMGRDLDEAIIQKSVNFGDLILEKYGDGLLAVMFGFASPEEAYKKADS
jgi:hypothetical protein